MHNSRKFYVSYQNDNGKGCIMIYVGNFFGGNRLSVSDRFLKFVRSHCTHEQQLALLAALEEEKMIHIGTARERIEKSIKKLAAKL